MNDRREFIAAALAGVAASLLTSNEADAAPVVRTLAQKDAPKINLDGWQVTATEGVTVPA